MGERPCIFRELRGPQHAPVDDPTKLGPIVEQLLASARLNSGMDGVPGSWPQPQRDGSSAGGIFG